MYVLYIYVCMYDLDGPGSTSKYTYSWIYDAFSIFSAVYHCLS